MKHVKNANSVINRITQYCILISAAAFFIMWLLSYDFYTSFGIDTDKVEGERVLSDYYRIRWPGNGSLWLGGGAEYRRLSAGPIEKFDLGGTFFDKPRRRPESHSFWNRVGFWRINESNDALRRSPSRRGLVCNFWFGIPCWIPAVFTGCLALIWRPYKKQ